MHLLKLRMSRIDCLSECMLEQAVSFATVKFRENSPISNPQIAKKHFRKFFSFALLFAVWVILGQVMLRAGWTDDLPVARPIGRAGL